MKTNSQLTRKTADNTYKSIYPIAYIDGIIDKESNEKLSDILVRYNHILVPWQGTIKKTRDRVTILMRRQGLWITYINNDYEIITEVYKGTVTDIIEHWSDDINWEKVPDIKYIQDNSSKIPNGAILPDHLSPSLQELIYSHGTVINMPDDEDLEQKNTVLKLKDREYNSELANNTGYKILRKNWTKVTNGTINILTQEMINKSNTIYEIRYDFNLNGKTINIPENCVLKFEGGKISNGIICGNNTSIETENPCFGLDVVFKGNFTGGFNSIYWFKTGETINTTLNKVFRNIQTDLSKNPESHDQIPNEKAELFTFKKGQYYIDDTIDIGRLAISLDFGFSTITALETFPDGNYMIETIDAARNYDTENESQSFSDGYNGGNISNLFLTSLEDSRQKVYGIRIYWSFKTFIHDIKTNNLYGTGIYVGRRCPETLVNNCSLYRNDAFTLDTDSESLNMPGYVHLASDCYIQGVIAVHYPIGYLFKGPGNTTAVGLHPWGWPSTHPTYPKSCRIGIMLEDTSASFLDCELDSTEPMDASMSCDADINGAINGGCGFYIKNAYNSFFQNIVTSSANKKGNIHTVFIVAGWHLSFINIREYDNGCTFKYSESFDNSKLRTFTFLNCDNTETIIGNFKDNHEFVTDENIKFYYTNALNHHLITNDDSDRKNDIVLGRSISGYPLFRVDQAYGNLRQYNFIFESKLEDDKYIKLIAKSRDFENTIQFGKSTDELSSYCGLFQKIGSNTREMWWSSTNNIYFDSSNKKPVSLGRNQNPLDNVNLNYIIFTNLSEIPIPSTSEKILCILNNELVTNVGNSTYEYRALDGSAPGTLKQGNTSNRPSIDNLPIGYRYFNTERKVEEVWNGSNWYSPYAINVIDKQYGKFSEKPTNPLTGFSYFCTDKQTSEGSTNGIMIYYKGDNVWVDALGRVVE